MRPGGQAAALVLQREARHGPVWGPSGLQNAAPLHSECRRGLVLASCGGHTQECATQGVATPAQPVGHLAVVGSRAGAEAAGCLTPGLLLLAPRETAGLSPVICLGPWPRSPSSSGDSCLGCGTGRSPLGAFLQPAVSVGMRPRYRVCVGAGLVWALWPPRPSFPLGSPSGLWLWAVCRSKRPSSLGAEPRKWAREAAPYPRSASPT